jgi:eukaryotic-like serine/threonine-protein kinase
MSDREPTLLSEGTADDPFAGTAYRTVQKIGEGGMGVVLEVEHLALGKRLVAKVLKPELVGDANLSDRFRFEAQVLAQLAHPNLVPVLDLGRTRGGQPYFVMEKLTGRTLGEELRARGRLPIAEAIEITLEVLAGLGAAHAHGLVHRDVKLDNVFLCDARPAAGTRSRETARRTVKLLDFGVAKAPRSGPALAAPPSHPTAEGVLVGTPRYVAPEQIRGGAVDARADLYAAGTMLYTLLVGRSPFSGVSGLGLLHAHLNEAPRPLSSYPDAEVPPALDAIVLRALAKRPDDRQATAGELAEELLQILEALAAGGQGAAGRQGKPSLTARGTERIVAPADPVRLRAAHAARDVRRSTSGAGERGPEGEAEESAALDDAAAGLLRTEGEAEREPPMRLRDVGVLLAVLAASAVLFWLLLAAGARLVGWR